MGEIPYHHLTRKVTTISPYKYRSILPQKVCNNLALKAVDIFLSLDDRTDLGIGEASGTPLPDHLVSIVFLQITHRTGSANRPIDSNLLQSSIGRKNTISLASSVGTTDPLLIKLNSQ